MSRRVKLWWVSTEWHADLFCAVKFAEGTTIDRLYYLAGASDKLEYYCMAEQAWARSNGLA